MASDPSMIETANQPIIIRQSRWKLLLLSLGSLVFVLTGLSMVNSSQSSSGYYEGLASLIFFGLCLLVFLFQMFTSSLLLKIDNEGIHCFYPLWRPRSILWEEIFSIYPIKMRFMTILTVTVSPTGKPTYLARNSKPDKIPLTLRSADRPATAISLSLATATLSAPKVIALIQQRYAAQIGRYQISVLA